MEEQKQLFQEVNEGYTMLEAINEAKRCLHCKIPQCQKGCPISHDIPDWIHELSMGNLGNAMRIINDKSNLPAVCGRVCPHEKQCEGHCVLAKKGQGIHVGKLERFVADFDGDMGLIRDKLKPKTRGKVAVIGSGPAGLTIAGDLARQGFSIEIFEMEPEPGGVLMFGIPEYRLPKDVVRREIKKIEELGVVFHCNTTIGTDLNIDQLFEQGFDAIFMGTGTVKPRKPDIPGRNLRGVRQAVYFLRKVSLYNEGSIEREDVPVQEGDRVFVLGCGNTAMDAARTAIRMGARSVEIIYHNCRDRNVLFLITSCDSENILLPLISQSALPESKSPIRHMGRIAGKFDKLLVYRIRRIACEYEYIYLLSCISMPVSTLFTEGNPACSWRIPYKSISL